MNRFRTFAAPVAVTLLLAPAAGSADVVLDWNEIALAEVVAARQHPTLGTRTMAMVHGAIFDAVGAIERRYEPILAGAPAPAGASADAAAIAAAHAVLTGLFPERRAALDEILTSSLAGIPDGDGKAAGIALGAGVGDRWLAERADDGSAAPERYRPDARPGVYVPTAVPVASQWARVRPFVLGSGDELRPEPPPALASAAWARDYEEVRTLGARASAVRTPEQTEAARFWTITGPVAWNPVVRSLALSREATPLENARLFALANLAASDALVAVFDAKYAYALWRPITAIRDADLDGNDATAPEPGWVPLVETPMHPEYPCAHCITSAAVGEILESEFGTGEVPAIEMTSSTAPGVVHRWTRIRDYVTEVSNARVWGGIHYRTSVEVGERMGREIGERAVRERLRPVQSTAGSKGGGGRPRPVEDRGARQPGSDSVSRRR